MGTSFQELETVDLPILICRTWRKLMEGVSLGVNGVNQEIPKGAKTPCWGARPALRQAMFGARLSKRNLNASRASFLKPPKNALQHGVLGLAKSLDLTIQRQINICAIQ